MNNTVRRYPRTLAEAFPKDYACAIERPAPYFDPVPWACAAAVVALVVLAIYGAI